jgi:Uma2 family endonuclease
MSARAERLLTPEEYLDRDRAAEIKSEYFAGRTFAMAGGTEPHALIGATLLASLHVQLRGTPCRTYGPDLRIEVRETGLFTYADASVVCGDPMLRDGRRDTILNPTLLVEVLSPSTEAYDRGDKFAHYRQLASLGEYLLIAQDRPRIERYHRPPGSEQWVLSEIHDPDGALDLPSIGCRLSLREVYDRVTFPDPPPPLRLA